MDVSFDKQQTDVATAYHYMICLAEAKDKQKPKDSYQCSFKVFHFCLMWYNQIQFQRN